MEQKKSRAQQTAERLYHQIVIEKQYTTGEKLPNEVELAGALGVSRATLREALQTLAAQGVLEVRRGRGTFVKTNENRDFDFAALRHVRAQLRDLFELRSIFEPGVARLACMRATAAELEEILQCGAAVEQKILAGEDRTAADRAFHGAIVRATHNEFMMRLLPVIDRAVEVAIASGEHGEELAEDTLNDHALLMDFFRKHDAEGAEYAMAIHLHHGMAVLGVAP